MKVILTVIFFYLFLAFFLVSMLTIDIDILGIKDLI
jgi:hypothetical protein